MKDKLNSFALGVLFGAISAKAQWALENRKTQNEIPTDADLVGPGRYMPERPECPSGGNYKLGAGWEKPHCSISGHIF
jgi:hypothetical protein